MEPPGPGRAQHLHFSPRHDEDVLHGVGFVASAVVLALGRFGLRPAQAKEEFQNVLRGMNTKVEQEEGALAARVGQLPFAPALRADAGAKFPRRSAGEGGFSQSAPKTCAKASNSTAVKPAAAFAKRGVLKMRCLSMRSLWSEFFPLGYSRRSLMAKTSPVALAPLVN